MTPEQHYRVNWIEGMKVSKENFINTENALNQLINYSNQRLLTPVNYGLSPDYSKEGSSIEAFISVDGQGTIEVLLNKCKALTLSGYQINITKETKALLEHSGYILKTRYEVSETDNEFYVVLSVNPYNRIPVGDADPEEEPPRHPYVLPEYKLDVIPKTEMNSNELGMYHLTIGKVVYKAGVATVDENFIPPCQSIQSHTDLKYVYAELVTFLNRMEAYSLHVVQKIHQKEQTNNLAVKALTLCEMLIHYLSTTIAEFRTNGWYSSPIYMVNTMSSLARIIKNELDVSVGTGKEEFLNYLTDWCDLNQGAFENVLAKMIDVEYKHTDINETLTKIHKFAKVILSLFKKLSELDYIGFRKKDGVFVKEDTVIEVPKNEKRGSILDL